MIMIEDIKPVNPPAPRRELASLPEAAAAQLRQRFGSRFETSAPVCDAHAQTITWLPRQPPHGVVFACGVEDVQDAVAICARARIPIIPYGAGTSLEGQVNAPHGGISLDLSRMADLIKIAADDMYCVVQPGMTHERLNEALRPHGLFFSVDPGANATLGGMASTRASGTNAVRYGTMRDNVLALEVVLASGVAVRTGTAARKSASGYDLTRLFVGAEGTLGVVTELTLRVFPLPAEIAAGTSSFDSIERATSVVVSALRAGVDLARIELVDEISVDAFNRYSGLALAPQPALFVEFHGEPAHVAHHAARFSQIAADAGGRFTWATAPEERRRLWAARHDAWWAIHKMFPGRTGVTTDVCVPLSELPGCIRQARSSIAEMGLDATILGHVGDGNFHVLVMPERDGDARVHDFIGRLNEIALRAGGTCSGEHGVGQGKIAYAAAEHGAAIAVMRDLKAALDPHGIMNPGKLFAGPGHAAG